MTLEQELRHKIDNKTKPIGALGILEEVALRLGLVQQRVNPSIRQPHIVVFAGDHGIAETGLVNPYPQEVTGQMVLNFLHGGATINVFCRQHEIALRVVNAGVKHLTAKENDAFIDASMGPGTNNYLETVAMPESTAKAAIEKGKDIVRSIAASGCNCIGFGEMGIGNTSSASLIMSAVTGLSIEACTGRGTGANDEQLQRKLDTLKKVYTLHQLDKYGNHAIALLSKVGGFEIALMTGAYLEAAHQKMVIVVDGFIATAALLLAQLIDASVLECCVFAHTSGEKGHEGMLQYLHAKPLLQLGMRLGEGTGAALAIPLIQSAALFLAEMASFDSAGVSGQS